jgi:hypothetical protein
MIERGQHLRLTLEAREPLGIFGEEVGKKLQRHVAVQPGVAGPLAHAAGAQRWADLERADTRATRERHCSGWRGL